MLRSIPKSLNEADVAKAVAYAKKIRLYPLTNSNKPAETVFVDAYDKMFDATIPYNLHFFELLNEMVQKELWITRDRIMINSLKSIGIEKANLLVLMRNQNNCFRKLRRKPGIGWRTDMKTIIRLFIRANIGSFHTIRI